MVESDRYLLAERLGAEPRVIPLGARRRYMALGFACHPAPEWAVALLPPDFEGERMLVELEDERARASRASPGPATPAPPAPGRVPSAPASAAGGPEGRRRR